MLRSGARSDWVECSDRSVQIGLSVHIGGVFRLGECSEGESVHNGHVIFLFFSRFCSALLLKALP